MTPDAPRRGFSVRVFLPDGDPAGLKVIEKSNWTGAGLVIPRALFARARARPELGRAGVYVLVGESERGSLPKVYVGEGDPVLPRLEEHGRRKEFWTHAVVFTCKDQSLNKAHVQRLEARLVALAGEAKRCVLDNGNTPQPPSLAEADTADVDGFLDKETGGCPPYLRALRADLLGQGVLRDAGERFTLTQDYTFTSPSAAAGVMVGASANGREVWKTGDGRVLSAVQNAGGGA